MPIVCREGRASLGPRVFTRGNETLIAYYGGAVARFNGATRLHAWKRETEAELTRLRNEASMGPRVFTRGNESSPARTVLGSQASMGPRVFTRGNRKHAGDLFHSGSGFNGATRLHAWKLQNTSAFFLRASCFNGATRLHAWKRSELARMLQLSFRASMGPRVFTRGNRKEKNATKF